MKNFKEIFQDDSLNRTLTHASVSVKHKNHELFLDLNKKDQILGATYTGSQDPWLASLCSIIVGKTLNEGLKLGWSDWDKAFKEDQFFWDLRQEKSEFIFFEALELLKATLDKYRGREYLYHDRSPLVCRCFGVREEDVIAYLAKEENPTLEGLGVDTKAGMGCRSCVPQLTRWLSQKSSDKSRFYKNRTKAEWLILIDEVLNRFPEAKEWKMEVLSLEKNQVIIAYDKKVAQREEEEVARRLQLFLSEGVDSDLGFFLRRV